MLPMSIRMLVAACLLALPSPAMAQRFVHDAAREAQADVATAAAKDLAGKSLADAQLANLDEVGRLQLDTILRWQEVRLRSTVNSFARWDDVTTVLDGIDAEIADLVDSPAEAAAAPQRLREIKERAAAIQAELQSERGAAKDTDDVLGQILSHVGDAKEVVEFAEGVLKGSNAAKIQAANEVIATLEQIQKMHAAVKSIFAAHAGVSVPAASLRPDPRVTELEYLRVEEAHLKRAGLLRARRALDVGELKGLIEQTRAHLSTLRLSGKPLDVTAEIEQTLRRLIAEAVVTDAGGPTPAVRRGGLEFALYVLHRAGAVAAQHQTAGDFARLRDSLELRRYSLESAAVDARTYELTVRAAVDRLAVYWKSGLKARDVADFLFHLSSAVSLPIIASRQ